MSLPTPLTGVVPPLCTPLTPSGEVDTRSLTALAERLIGAGVSGLFVLGSSGEAAFLSDRRRRAVLEAVTEAAAGRVPVLAGVIDMTTERVLDHARTAVESGVDGLVATAPFYTRTHPVEIADHFRRIRGGAGLPLFAYDIPASVHTKLTPATVLPLAAEGTLAGLKDSSGDDGALRRLLVEVRRSGLHTSFSVLTGSELAVDGALLAGVHGVVPGLGNVDPEGYVRLYEHARAGRWERAAAEQDRLAALFAITDVGDPAAMGGSSSALGAFKAALHLLDVIDCPATAPPQVPLGDAAVKSVRQLLEYGGLLP
ncbi:dihydrodipicolinate synthase family protein [Streptomyces sp. NBS 14/10]|uniref:dihydrodipicolinate synthase family protein n=1 Tax=Streptomyces sp. NBS 14/10 TaxID=1945643 RepID=UPI000B7E1A59|nr:dihydrodipicolinate synthase family protein [Streptomyces sp. NBS 14/10]KAK1183221.1 dihydrodipicolinate synthase family protein [Streptomyces sp. NBS 14/10]NUP36744.1 dihydrodipicolinate synthase family protein [Streptomyces sp.]NUS86556.1 dihydrodipicolinate synthase family protein [Streptomyces sp.]